jgi:hypothetical protein
MSEPSGNNHDDVFPSEDRLKRLRLQTDDPTPDAEPASFDEFQSYNLIFCFALIPILAVTLIISALFSAFHVPA